MSFDNKQVCVMDDDASKIVCVKEAEEKTKIFKPRFPQIPRPPINPRRIRTASLSSKNIINEVSVMDESLSKRALDIAFALVGLVLVCPVITVVAILIKVVSPGPVFFKQERVGYKGKKFEIYKMRTMRVDAEKNTGPVWARENDPRLIKFGKRIRKLHLDELPQLWNVLRGDMSIVGPRPERPVFVENLSVEISDYRKRMNVKPGITGLAQVRNKYDETIKDVRKKVKYDLLYIRERCLMVDLRIILLTVLVAATGKGAR